MSLLPDSASFEELVQECFLAHRGAGLMLSPLDVALVMDWADAQVPLEVISRGIRRAAEKALWDARPGEPVLRTLRACRRDVEAEIKKWRSRAAGAASGRASVLGSDAAGAAEPTASLSVSVGESPRSDEGQPHRSFEAERHAKLCAALAKLGRTRPDQGAISSRLLALVRSRVPADIREADRQEEWVLAALLRAQPYSTRAAIYRDATAHAAGGGQSSARAKVLSRRFHRQALLRRALGLPSFW